MNARTCCGGRKALGRRTAFWSLVRMTKASSVTGVSSGAPFSFQSGISSSSARGSKTLPDRMCAPTSAPFSTTHTLSSWPLALASCFSRMAAARPYRIESTIGGGWRE
jgi:hypothetical protein